MEMKTINYDLVQAAQTVAKRHSVTVLVLLRVVVEEQNVVLVDENLTNFLPCQFVTHSNYFLDQIKNSIKITIWYSICNIMQTGTNKDNIR